MLDKPSLVKVRMLEALLQCNIAIEPLMRERHKLRVALNPAVDHCC